MFVAQALTCYSSQVNVLIDDNEKAVVCDFGLSQIRADVTSRTAILSDATPVAGSRNWMAPERLMGGSLRRPCDIYAFGIMIPEVCVWMLHCEVSRLTRRLQIYTNEAPLGHVVDFIELVVQRDVRPERPEDDETPHLSDAVWALAEQCWVKDPKQRPTAIAVCDTISHLLETTAAQAAQTQLQPSPSSPSRLDVRTTSPLYTAARRANVINTPPQTARLPVPERTSDDRCFFSRTISLNMIHL
jgi:serine/threonine protein kinase